MHLLLNHDVPFKRALLYSALYMTLFNTAVALFITYVLNTGGPFLMNWVFSMLIGTCITLLIDGCRWLLSRRSKPNRLVLLLVCLVAAPLGYYLGLTLGMLIYGIPIPNFNHLHERGDRVLVVMCIIISLVSGVFFWNQSKLAELRAQAEKEKARTAAIEKQAMQAQLQLLQAQIEPHMLFNTLANLQGLITLDPPRAQYMLEQLIVYLRASLSSSRTDKTTLGQEFGLMRAYLELLAIRMGKRLSYTLDLPAALQASAIAPMLLQPLVENAIKHGLEPKIEGGTIHVSARQEGAFLHLSVSDTGLGLPFDYQETPASGELIDNNDDNNSGNSSNHIGNANVRERLLALYGPGASLTLSANQPEGVIAHLCIPMAAPLAKFS